MNYLIKIQLNEHGQMIAGKKTRTIELISNDYLNIDKATSILQANPIAVGIAKVIRVDRKFKYELKQRYAAVNGQRRVIVTVSNVYDNGTAQIRMLDDAMFPGEDCYCVYFSQTGVAHTEYNKWHLEDLTADEIFAELKAAGAEEFITNVCIEFGLDQDTVYDAIINLTPAELKKLNKAYKTLMPFIDNIENR